MGFGTGMCDWDWDEGLGLTGGIRGWDVGYGIGIEKERILHHSVK